MVKETRDIYDTNAALYARVLVEGNSSCHRSDDVLNKDRVLRCCALCVQGSLYDLSCVRCVQ